MSTLLQIPEWLASALLGAILGALAYIGKLIIELFQSFKDRRRVQRSKLIELQSLLNATRIAFKSQHGHAVSLTDMIEKNYGEVAQQYNGYEEKISRTFSQLNIEEKELHAIIRSITVSTLFPINSAILEWLREDVTFKATKSKDKVWKALAAKLVILESHLLLWVAKYNAWIPVNQQHALVYMADEKKHGLGFPDGMDLLIDEAVKKY
jgi:hypothetical protein